MTVHYLPPLTFYEWMLATLALSAFVLALWATFEMLARFDEKIDGPRVEVSDADWSELQEKVRTWSHDQLIMLHAHFPRNDPRRRYLEQELGIGPI